MTLSFSIFLNQCVSNPLFLFIVLLTLAVIFVNGATDATNAISTVIATRAMSPASAIALAAVFNFVGTLIMTLASTAVAATIYKMVDFRGDQRAALIALAAAMFGIVVWGVVAWFFGIPTSESHALIAGLTGAAIALQGGLSGVNGWEWMKVVYGLGLSTVLGLIAGWIVVKVVGGLFKSADRRATSPFFRGAQMVGAAGMAFMHGAQDGQKFMSTLLLGMLLATGTNQSGGFTFPLWLILLCSATMGIGTAIGGKRIIKKVGLDMVKLEGFQGFSADAAASVVLLISSLAGLPVSTTHTKTTAIMGVGAAKRVSSVNWHVAGEMIKAWILTFPGCGLIGFVLAYLLIRIF